VNNHSYFHFSPTATVIVRLDFDCPVDPSTLTGRQAQAEPALMKLFRYEISSAGGLTPGLFGSAQGFKEETQC
jgi:hypothetical protein